MYSFYYCLFFSKIQHKIIYIFTIRKYRTDSIFENMIANGNFYEAAEQFHVSQSAVSQQIKKLDVNLLDRHNRTFSLTVQIIIGRHV